jgi:lysophospholipid acyltransferase (LPLAT)-like uncharacterized protein
MPSPRDQRHSPARRRLRALKYWLLMNVGVYLAWAAAWLHARTLRVRWEGREHWERARDRPLILAFYHGDMVSFALGVRSYGKGVAGRTCMMSSPSRDGLVNAKFMRLLGCRVVIGSSAKRGVEALLSLRHEVNRGFHVGIAVDGPRGPRHAAKPGAALLSKHTGAPVLAFTVTPERSWRLRDWAQTEIPRPFTRLVVRVAPPRVVEDAEDGTAWLTQALRDLKP